MLKTQPFIEPSVPLLRREPPLGPGWIHEVKFDGWRVQIHKQDYDATLYSRTGADLSRRFPLVRDAVLSFPVRLAVIDAELVACDSEGKPDFQALMRRSDELCLWCFDLLALNGVDLRNRPLIERKRRLEALVAEADDHTIRYSAEFSDPLKLLEVVDKWKLEGIVSKRADQPYRSGKNPGWVKVKSVTWCEENKSRLELFQARGPKARKGEKVGRV